MDGNVGRENKVVGSLAKTDGSSGVGQGSSAPAARHHGTARGDLDERDKWRNSEGRTPDDGRADDATDMA